VHLAEPAPDALLGLFHVNTLVVAAIDLLRAKGYADPAFLAPGLDNEGPVALLLLLGLTGYPSAFRFFRIGLRFRNGCFHHVVASLLVYRSFVERGLISFRWRYDKHFCATPSACRSLNENPVDPVRRVRYT
jgi:hypothetical protein